MRRLAHILTLALLAPAAGIAQDLPLPEYAYEAVTRISLANTAKIKCAGAQVDDRKLERAMVDLVGRLARDGLDPIAAVNEMDTDAGKAELARREAALRQEHGVAAEGDDALCAAIKAELRDDKALADLVTMR